MISSIWTFTRRSLRGTLPLLLLVLLVALPAAVALHPGQGPALASQLFESPVSPVQQPTAAPQVRVPAAPQPTAKPKPEKVLPPTVPPPAAQPAQVEPTAVPPTQPPPAQQRVPAAPTQAPAAEAPTSPPPTTAPPAEEQATPVPPPPPVPGEEVQPGSGSGEVIIDSGLLIDSILVYVSYAWLCCGILLFILIPIVFVGLYIWGAQRRKNANGFE